MLSQNQLDEIKEYLEKSQNPLFFFDNDVDGLCSYLLLQRAIGRGRGVAVKSFPELNSSYIRKINELNPDIVFILDKPKVSSEFINEVYEKNIPIIWIDHHDVQLQEEVKEKVHYYNSFPEAEPVTYISYKIFKNKKDMWIAMIGCIGDVYMPDFAEEFSQNNSDLFDSNLSAFDSLYLTDIGKIIRILNFSLMDTTTNVVNLIKYLTKINNIHDILEETSKTFSFHKRYQQLNKIYQKLINKAETNLDNSKILFFTYSGETSMSSEVANALYFKHKDKTIAVGFKKQDKTNFSIRGKKALEITQKAIKEIENSAGGGHKEATGLQIPADKLGEFKTLLSEF